MRSSSKKGLCRREVIERIIIAAASMLLIYLLISLYFKKHFLFNTVINGANVSLKAKNAVESVIVDYISGYELQLIDRNGRTEVITGRNIEMQYNENNSIDVIIKKQNPFRWISSIFKVQKNCVDDLYTFNEASLNDIINKLDCMNKDIIEPRNVSFKYSNGAYDVIGEVYGNKLNSDKLYETVKTNITEGSTKLNLNDTSCYEQPTYTLGSDKTFVTRDILNKYVSTSITYKFDSRIEILDGSIINEWLSVDENLEVVLDNAAVMEYIIKLSEKYDTVKAIRKINTSTGKIVELKGGLYGWKISKKAEVKALLEYLPLGEVIEREPIYARRALSRGENDIGNTYVEINITKQHLWFYMDGNLIVEGPVVTGNPNRGNATVKGTFFLNYKQKDETLSGRGYEVKVTYWMPFYGNMGIHDASWRSAFGGEIYKSKGTHGCVNAPLYLAKKIYENIEDGIPIICYEE